MLERRIGVKTERTAAMAAADPNQSRVRTVAARPPNSVIGGGCRMQSSARQGRWAIRRYGARIETAGIMVSATANYTKHAGSTDRRRNSPRKR